MKCSTCNRSHKGKEDMERAHRLKAERERDLYRARAIDEVQDHHNTDKVQAAFDVDLEVQRHLQGITFVILFLAMPFLTGCEGVRHLLGQDRHDAKHVDVPVATTIIRDLPAASGITFHPDPINGAPNKVRVFVKTGDWLHATPGGWYEIPWAEDVDGRTTEYAVISFAGQGARVYNQPASSPRAIIVESVPPGAFDPGRPSE